MSDESFHVPPGWKPVDAAADLANTHPKLVNGGVQLGAALRFGLTDAQLLTIKQS
jgi:hypothetical protein